MVFLHQNIIVGLLKIDLWAPTQNVRIKVLWDAGKVTLFDKVPG